LGYPEDVRYTAEHEWARLDQGIVTVGITSYATGQLGDVVFVELPQAGRQLEAKQPFGVIEAVKTVSDLFAPVSGEVVEVNGALAAKPELVNQDPSGPGELDQLMSSADYAKHVEEQHA
jgi:glycine cleavage system H protein